MGERNTEPDVLLTWFRRQRRGWWRANWWGPVLLLVLWLFTPIGQTMLMQHVPGLDRFIYTGPARFISSGLTVLQNSPYVYPVILLIGIWLVARLGATYSFPNDLLLTADARECNRAFTAVLRRDAYLVLGGFTILPFVVIRLLAVGFNTGGLFIFVLVLGGPLALLVELSIYLRVIKRRAHILLHTLVPPTALMAAYVSVALLVMMLAGFAGNERLAGDLAWFFILPVLGLVCAIAAWVLFRRSYSARIDCDSWRER